jgi:hypothetical protein
MQRDVAFAAFSVIGREFCCTSKTHVIAADGLLHIQTAHPKRKCNRPLSKKINQNQRKKTNSQKYLKVPKMR